MKLKVFYYLNESFHFHFAILEHMKGNIVSLPADAPKIGEVYRHYKGDLYEVTALVFHSNDEEWMVVYKPLYANPIAHLFTRPAREWNEETEWPVASGQKSVRFRLIAD